MKTRKLKIISLLLCLLMILPILPVSALVSSAAGTDPTDPANIAYGKPTRSNSTTGDASLTVDGKDSTYWSAKEFPMYVDVDLLQNYELTGVKIVMPAGKWSYEVYASLDGVHFTTVASHPYENVTSGGDFYEVSGQWRVLRVNVTTSSSGSGGNSRISEIRAYGTPVSSSVTKTRDTIAFSSYSEWLKNNYDITLGENYTVADTFTFEDTKEALYGIIERILGAEYKSWFDFDLCRDNISDDHYIVTSDGKKVTILGNNGSSMAVGLNAFLKEYCGVQVSQQTANVTMPASIPVIDGSLTGSSPYEVRYAYNYCTLSYTMPFYGFDDWQRELDYLALSGVNVILDTTATEALWVSYLQKFGYTADEAKNYVSGYAYKAWWLMGNLENYGGSVSDEWIIDTLEMARRNQRFMTVLGIKPCLQGFMGTLPTTFSKIAGKTLTEKGYANIAPYMVAQGDWSGFTRPPLLKTTYDGYTELADTFYNTQKELYGDITDYYAGDLAHEGGVIPTDLSRSIMAGQILDHMIENDEDAVWIIQCWWGNPEKAVLDGFGAENRANHLLVLDLNATVSSNYANSSSWGGREWNGSGWAFCMLDNYGGRPGVHGELEYMMKEIIKAYKATSHMKGIGLVSEGTQMNPVVQELLWEMAWHTEVFDIDEWIHAYAARRYGASSEKINEAWDLLLDTAYGYAGAHEFNVNSIVNMLPSFSPSAISGSANVNYDGEKFEKAVDLFLSEFDRFADKETYVYDAVDLIKQLLSNSMAKYFNTFVTAYNDKETDAAWQMADKFLETIVLLDEVCSYEADSTIGEWLGRIDRFVNDERTGSYDDYSLDTMRYNAKAIITAWCCKGLHTYGYRQYSGQLMDYNYVMWSAFFEAVKAGSTLPSYATYFMAAWNFVLSDKTYENTVIPARGDQNHRSLSALYEEVAENYLYANAAELRSVTANVALSGTAYAKNAQGGMPASRLNDGDLTGLWVGTSSAFPTYAGITLDREYAVNEVIIVAETRGNLGADIIQYEIEALQNGKFVSVAQAQSYDPATKKYTVTVRFDTPVLTSDIRVHLKSVAAGSQIWPALAEIKVMSYGGLIYKGGCGEMINGMLSYVPEGMVAETLISCFTGDGDEISVINSNGVTRAASEKVAVGDVVVLRKDGDISDRVMIASIGEAPKPDKEEYTLSGLRYGSGMENWTNSDNNPLGKGKAPGVTEILFGVSVSGKVTSADLAYLYNYKEDYTFTLTITDEEGKTVKKNIRPASSFSTAESNYFYRFEPCLAEDIFVPVPGEKYQIDLTIENDKVRYMITGDSAGYVLSTYPVKADGTYYDASSYFEYPIDLTVAPFYDQIENTYGKTWFVTGVSAGKVNDLFYDQIKNGIIKLKVTIKDETEGVTYIIDEYAFDDPNGNEIYGTSFMRFAACEYGIIPVAGHEYTLTLEGYNGEELQFTGATETGAFSKTNGAFIDNGPIVPDNPAHTCRVLGKLWGDVNGDGLRNISDVTALLDMLSIGVYGEGADLTNDGTVNIQDVTVLLNKLSEE